MKLKRRENGFTLVEVLLATVLLALMVGGFATLYSSGLNSLTSQKERVILNSKLSSRMEELESREFSNLNDGSEVITVEGDSYTINWIVVPVDLARRLVVVRIPPGVQGNLALLEISALAVVERLPALSSGRCE